MKVKIKNPMIKKILGVIGGLVLIPSLIFNIYLYQKNQSLEGQNMVEKVIDGDTFIIKSGQRIRMGNLYAPEPELCGGQQAKERLEELILGKIVRLDIFSHDQYNRPLALVYINNVLTNEVLLKEGLARYDGTPSSQRDILKQAYDYALENKKGIFSSLCLSEKPENPDCLIKGNISRADGKKTYHFPGCSEYERTTVEKDLGESWFCTEKEAQKAGFKKAENCFGKKY
ncbi:thermonuclease family protein [Patescibacteria group bacterium]|nr:thermonuclease family protein [Patescibacteria group bacterium]